MISINVHWFWYLTTKIWCQTCIRGSAYSCKRAEVKQHKWLTKTTPSVSLNSWTRRVAQNSNNKVWRLDIGQNRCPPNRKIHDCCLSMMIWCNLLVGTHVLQHAWSKHSHNHVAYVFHDLQVAASFSLWALKYLPDTEPNNHALSSVTHAWKPQRIGGPTWQQATGMEVSPSWNNMNKQKLQQCHGNFDSWFFWEFLQVKISGSSRGYPQQSPSTQPNLRAKFTQRSWAGAASLPAMLMNLHIPKFLFRQQSNTSSMAKKDIRKNICLPKKGGNVGNVIVVIHKYFLAVFWSAPSHQLPWRKRALNKIPKVDLWIWRCLLAFSPWHDTRWQYDALLSCLCLSQYNSWREKWEFSTNNTCGSSVKSICDSFWQWKISILGRYQIDPSCPISLLKTSKKITTICILRTTYHLGSI